MKVYVKTDSNGIIQNVTSEAYINDAADWQQIDEGEGDRYLHAQCNYFSKPLIDDFGVFRYKLVEGQPAERTQDEMEADRTVYIPEMTTEDRIRELEETVQMLTDCLLDVSEQLYS